MPLRVSLILLLLPLLTFAQKKDSVAFKKANKIIIENKNSASENFALLQATLLKNGYSIKRSSRSYQISTVDSINEKRTASYILSGIAKENLIELSGKVSSTVATSVLTSDAKVFVYPIENLPVSFQKGAFASLEKIARQLNGKVFYIKEKVKGSIF